MERFPTEIMAQIASYLSKPDLSRFGTCSSKCAAIAQARLYHTITLLDITDFFHCCDQFLKNVVSRPHLPSKIRVLSILGHHKWPELSLAELLRHCDRIEELLLQGISFTNIIESHHSSHLAIFSNTPVARLRRFECLGEMAIPNLMKWVTRIPTLTDVRLPDSVDFNTMNYLKGAVVPPTWLGNLERYWGPPELLASLTLGCKLLHFSTYLEMSHLQLRQLATVCGNRLQTLHYCGNVRYAWETSQSQKLPAALLPQLFPNLRSVAWIPVNPLDREEVRPIFRDPPNLLLSPCR